jgi:DNA-nicking Smr family endonuclease
VKRKLTPEEARLWQSYIRDVKPISKIRKKPEEQPVSKALPSLRPVPRKVPQRSISLDGLQPFERRKLRHVKIEARLDMHGMTLDEGYGALERFLIRSQEKGLKTVLIITGKGSLSAENTLRRNLPLWLEETLLRSFISSFHYPAKQQDGGYGAYYVGIRKRVL